MALVAAMLAGGTAGGLIGLVVPTREEAKALIVVGQAPTNSGAVPELQKPALLAERVTSPGFVARAERALRAGGRSPSQTDLASLEHSLTAKALPNTPLVTVSVDSADGQLALAWMQAADATLTDEHKTLLEPAAQRVRVDAQAIREMVDRSRDAARQLVPAPGRAPGGGSSPLDIQQVQLFTMLGQDIRMHVDRLDLLVAALYPRNTYLTRLAEPITLDSRRARAWWIASAIAGATIGAALVVLIGLASPPRDEPRLGV